MPISDGMVKIIGRTLHHIFAKVGRGRVDKPIV